MIDELHFLNAHLVWPIIAGAVILLSVFIWKERQQKISKRFYFRIFAALLSVLTLLILALAPAIKRTTSFAEGVLLTPGYEERQLDSLKKVNKSLNIVDYQPGVPLHNAMDSISSLQILGHGLMPYDLWQLEKTQVNYLGGNTPDGIVRLKYSKKNYQGKSLVVNGLYNKPKSGKQIVLLGPGGRGLDSISLDAERQQAFQLRTDLKLAGNFVFSVIEKDSLGSVLYSEPLPVQILEDSALKILIVNEFPTFETKYLKNFLVEEHHKLVVRSRITRGKYKFEYFNTGRSPVYSFSGNNLDAFDLVIMDVDSYRNLSKNSRANLMHAIKENGLGLFIQADNNFFEKSDSFLGLDFERNKDTQTTLLSWPRHTVNKYAFLFKQQLALQAVHFSKDGVISAYKQIGQGRVGSSVLASTYQLLLKGNRKMYRDLWSTIIGKLGKIDTPVAVWEVSQDMIYMDEPYEFQLRTDLGRPAVMSHEGYSIPLISDPDIEGLWKGRTFPRESGWNEQFIATDSSTTHRYYVIKSTAWQALRAWNTIEENKRHFSIETENFEKTEKLIRISPVWFFLVFLCSMGFLWLSPKLDVN